MKITDIKTFPVWVGRRNQMAVKVETDEGIYGWGESGISGRELAVDGAVKHYREFLIGRDPMQMGALWQEMYRGQYFEGGRVLTAGYLSNRPSPFMILQVKLSMSLSISSSAGNKGISSPALLRHRHRWGPQLLDDVKLLINNGWNVIRTTPDWPSSDADKNIYEPRESIATTATWLTKLRESVGNEPILGIDYHHRLNVAEAASFCQRMPSGTLDFLEEPIRDETPEAYESLRTMTDVPFAIGEEISSKWHFLPYIERGITNFARIDICNVGGFTEAVKVASMAETHYIELMPHNPLGPICTAATIHLAAAVPNFAWLEVRTSPTENLGFSDKDIFPLQPELEGSRFPVPEGSGLGIEVDEESATKESFKFWEGPHIYRRDGSFTNW